MEIRGEYKEEWRGNNREVAIATKFCAVCDVKEVAVYWCALPVHAAARVWFTR